VKAPNFRPPRRRELLWLSRIAERSSNRLILAITFLSASAWNLSAGVGTGQTIITEGRPIVIATETTSTTGCTFAFSYLAHLNNPTSRRRVIADTGSCHRRALPAPGSQAGSPVRRVRGIEQLKGHQGTIRLRFDGSQERRRGRWGQAIGNWSTINATGAYAALNGRGQFESDETLVSRDYHGILITAR
jgi:hypothetical protein